MSFTANTAFEARITNNENNILSHIAGLYQASGANADCDAGRLVTADSLAPCEGFTGINNENTWYMVDATDAATIDTPVYACDTYDNKLIGDGSHNYFIGTETLGLGTPAGRYGNFTLIEFDNKSHYRFGEGNFSAAVGTNKYATIANGALVPSASAPATAGAIFFEIIGTGNFVEGASDSFGYVDVIAKKVSAA